MTAIVFLDTETTGLSLDDDIWEFAAIRRETDGTESEHHLFIQHDTGKCAQLPDSFLADHTSRWPGSKGSKSPAFAAGYIQAITEDRPHIVGAVPNFDTERIALLLRAHGYEPGWHYHLIDIENLAAGFLAGGARTGLITPPALPWKSNELSRAIGVEPPGEGERHTAMGDAKWARAVYDAVMGRCLMPLTIEPDPINHPAHYTMHPSGIECIQITEHMGFNLGNAFKYIWRADLKGDDLSDLRKAAWYVQREIQRRLTGGAA